MSQRPEDDRPDGYTEPFASPSGPTENAPWASPAPDAPPYGQDPGYGAPSYGQAPPPSYGQAPPPPSYGQAPPPSYGAPVPYAAGGYPGFGPPAITPPMHGSATTSMVLGIVSVVLVVLTCACGVTGPLAIFTGPIAIWLGVKARREINAAPQQYSGSGQAMGGLVCGIIGTIGALIIIAVIVFYVAIIGASLDSYGGY